MLAYVIVVFCSSSPVPWMVQAAAAPVSERSPASLRADALDTRGASAGAPLLAAVAAVLPLAVAIFGCVARNGGNGDADDGGGDELKRLKRKCKKLEKENKALKAKVKAADSSGPEREFWSDGSGGGGGGGASKDGSELKVPSETDIMVAQLGAVYTSLGKAMADKFGYTAELAALKTAKETTEYKNHLQDTAITPMEQKLRDADASVAKFSNDAVEMRANFAEAGMPLAKECEADYTSIFAEQTRGQAGGDAHAAICSQAASLKAGLPPAPADGTKAARQPDQPVGTLQRVGVEEAGTMYAAAMASLDAAGIDRAQLKGSSVCPVVKDAGRGFEKVYGRWGGDFLAVTDWGRATVSAATLALLARVLATVLAHLIALGYTVVAVKNTLDLAIDCTVNGGYRNLMLNLKCPRTGHIVELQFNLTPIEDVKQTRGHSVFELLRRCGFSAANSVVAGGWTENMDTAIRSGRAVELQCGQTSWDAAAAAGLKSALDSPGCRVVKVDARLAAGEGMGAMAAACAALASIKDLK